MAKWNEVLRIGRGLGDRARFEGAGIFAGLKSTPHKGRAMG
jgi:hypothetical protein